MPPKKADIPCGNPLLLSWIQEWMELARAQNSKTYHTYRKAYLSMSKYPLPFNHPREATQLEGIGPGIVSKLEKKMKEYCEKNDLPLPQEADPKPAKRMTKGKDSSGSEDVENPPKPRKRRTKPYVPQYRSGAYALLLGLLSGHDNAITQGFMSKEALTKEAQAYCDTSFTVPLPGKHYTSWSSMKTLIDKDLVYKQGNPGRYILTESGLTLAHQLSQAKTDVASDSESVISRISCTSMTEPVPSIYPTRMGAIQRTDSTLSEASSIGSGDALFPAIQPIQLPPGSFEIVMILDNREVAQKSDRGYIQKELERRGVPVHTRNLELGDVLWVARQLNCGGSEEEIFLGYVVERKRMDDLVASIKDGRFKEQKFRLKNCGASQIVYLVEGNEADGTRAFGGSTAIQTAISSTQVVDGFFLKKTDSVDESINYLSRMTRQLQSMYTESVLHVIPDSLVNKATYLALREHLAGLEPGKEFHITYGSYCQLNSKSGSLSLQDLFIKMLVTTRGITAEKAYEIAKRYPTPKSLFDAYDSLDSEEAKKHMLKDNARAVRRKNIGAALSERLYRVWCSTNYE
ncbi:putative DNA repair protein Mus81 [Basidiobolus meristosporus CBS 931.73]|uniref:Crossover junction endonuclease MUS81 n=1 Tax=Basidiobolus meristosporus CBS 931.73 TaxID=1314790 RepID=A0A1Y1Z1L0_9FUNG|nr:putative DNA repair protein Mus81 [Basidiobolus meristosporus CBS 931.73]|eukprot:ORY04066.1 putative DNA repair protein Mus81 [Basidiobolus meristosporus CBS 931.73]